MIDLGEFPTMDRCAAYVAARGSLDAINRASIAWPDVLAGQARQLAVDAVVMIADGIGQPHGSPARRRCLRLAITHAVEVAATLDIVRAMGLATRELDHAHRFVGRTIALLGLFFHASGQGEPEDD